MTKINGKTDPLRKTLVIIDEAHKLYSPDTIAAERPNIEIMNDKIRKRMSENCLKLQSGNGAEEISKWIVAQINN